MKLDLSSATIVVTGAVSGIGLAVAKSVHDSGGCVLIHGRSKEQAAECASKLGERASSVGADLADDDAPEIIIDAALSAFGRLDGLVNNASIFPRDHLDDFSRNRHDLIYRVNTRASLLLVEQAVAAFRRHGDGGSVVNIGSINAHCGQSDLLSYSMSKGALQTMTRNLGNALGPENIRVNQLNVGWTLTEKEIQTQLAEGKSEEWVKEIPEAFAPSGSILLPENIAPHVLFWLSRASCPINGQVYEVEQYPLIGRNLIATP